MQTTRSQVRAGRQSKVSGLCCSCLEKDAYLNALLLMLFGVIGGPRLPIITDLVKPSPEPIPLSGKYSSKQVPSDPYSRFSK